MNPLFNDCHIPEDGEVVLPSRVQAITRAVPGRQGKARDSIFVLGERLEFLARFDVPNADRGIVTS